MTKFRRVLTGILVLGSGAGLFNTPLALAACDLAAQAKACCCPMTAPKSDCCQAKKSTKCPVLQEKSPIPFGILPAKTLLSYVVTVTPRAAFQAAPALSTEMMMHNHNLSPPTTASLSPHHLRAPPSLA